MVWTGLVWTHSQTLPVRFFDFPLSAAFLLVQFFLSAFKEKTDLYQIELKTQIIAAAALTSRHPHFALFMKAAETSPSVHVPFPRWRQSHSHPANRNTSEEMCVCGGETEADWLNGEAGSWKKQEVQRLPLRCGTEHDQDIGCKSQINTDTLVFKELNAEAEVSTNKLKINYIFSSHIWFKKWPDVPQFHSRFVNRITPSATGCRQL